MRLAIALAAAAMGLAAAGAAAAAPSVEIRDAVARVTVVPEDRTDVKVDVLTSNAALPLDIRTSAGRTVIDGNLRHRIRDCRNRSDHPGTRVEGVGEVTYDNMPQLVIHTPRAVSLSTNGVVYGSIGRSASVELENSGCSGWTLADVAGEATLHESGAGSVRMGASGRLALHISGAGSVHATQVRDGLEATLSGAGGVRIDDLRGPVMAHVSGTGRINVAQGHATAIQASVSGVGGVDFGGDAQTLDASISGLGGIRVKAVSGSVTKSVSGIGRVTIG